MAERVALIVGGIFCICGAVFNWEFFFTNHKARFPVTLFGREGARAFYAVLGILFITAGIFLAW